MINIKQAELFNCAHEILLAVGESPDNAKTVADSMVLANSRGITTHGTYLLTPISNRVKAGQLSLPTRATLVVDEAAVAAIDGGDGLGAVAGKLAADISIERAMKFGISLALIRNTNSLGALAFYTEMVARHGMIALMACNAAPAMPPWGGAEAFLGTNPFAIAIYTGKDMLFSADMASSIVARGKIRKAAREGKPIPSDWAVDEEGNFTTDPVAALKGTLLPMGGPKGSAIALAVDILSGILAGAQHAPDIKSFHALDGATGVGATLIAIDIQKFMKLDVFAASMEDYFVRVKSLKKASFASEIFMPGEIEYRKGLESQQQGIPLSEEAVEGLNQLLQQIGSKLQLAAI